MKKKKASYHLTSYIFSTPRFLESSFLPPLLCVINVLTIPHLMRRTTEQIIHTHTKKNKAKKSRSPTDRGVAEGNSNALKGTNRLNGYYNRIDGEREPVFYNENAVVNDKRVLICQTQFFSTAKVWIRPQIVQDTFRPRSLTSKKRTRSITCG